MTPYSATGWEPVSLRAAGLLMVLLAWGCGEAGSSDGQGTAGATGTTAGSSGAGGASGGQDHQGGNGGAAVGAGGTNIASLPPKACEFDRDCAFGKRIDSCCADCAEAFSTAFIRASRCVVGLGEPAPEGCRPADCEPCAPSDCTAWAGVMCESGACTAVAGPGGYDCARERAFCPEIPPSDGGDCCNASADGACESVCLASTFACRYDRCLQTGEILDALCDSGQWQVEAVSCPSCPISCEAEMTCVVFGGSNDTAECRNASCGPGYVDCDCGDELCDRAGATCGLDVSGGHVLGCPIAMSASGM
jgi:hypothetical protein